MGKFSIVPVLGFGLVVGLESACGGDSNGDPAEPRPVVFAHGCPPPPFDSTVDAGFWTGETQNAPGMVDFFAERDYTDDLLNVFLYPGETCPPNHDYASALSDYVDEVLADTGQSRVDLIGFSVGAVAGRIYIREGGDEFVEDYVSIAGASHGSVLAGMVGEAGQKMYGYPSYEGALEVSPPYACEGDSTEADVQFFLNGCLTEDGRTVEEDETPFDVGEGGHIRYLSVWNDQDDLVIPPEASCLNQTFIDDCSDEVNLQVSIEATTIFEDTQSAHVETQFDPTVRQAVYDFVVDARD